MSTTPLSNNILRQTLCRTRPDIVYTDYPGTYLKTLFGDDEGDHVHDANEAEIRTISDSGTEDWYSCNSGNNSGVWESNNLSGGASSSAT